MLDIQDFIKERGGDPDKIRKSQELRHADVGLVDKVIELFEDHSTCPSHIMFAQHQHQFYYYFPTDCDVVDW